MKGIFTRSIVYLLIVSLLTTSCSTMVTQKVLTPKTTEHVTMPKLYPVMMERQSFNDQFDPTKKIATHSVTGKFYYDDLKGMFYDNVRLNFTETEGSNFAYMRLNSLEVRMKDKGWYLLPSILTLCYANLMGCPFMGVRSTIDASVSILDCEGKEIKRYEIKEKGSSSGGLYTIGRDVGRFAYIKACKDVLETLNEKIQQDSYEINMALSQAEERVMAMRQQGFAAVNANDPYFSQGLACFSKGDYEQSTMLFTKVLENSPQHYMALLYRGVSSFNQGRYSQAMRDLKNTTLINPSVGEAYFYQACIQQKYQKKESAIMYARRAIDVQPNQEEYYILCGTLLLETQEFEEAKSIFKKLLEINPDRVEIYEIIPKIDGFIQSKKDAENAQYLQMVTSQARAVQSISQAMTSSMANLNNTSTSKGFSSYRSRESIQRDLEKAEKRLADMERNRGNDDSGVNRAIYDRMIQDEENNIELLKEELRNAKE